MSPHLSVFFKHQPLQTHGVRVVSPREHFHECLESIEGRKATWQTLASCWHTWAQEPEGSEASNPGTTASWLCGFENIIHLSEPQSSHPCRLLTSTLLFYCLLCLFVSAFMRVGVNDIPILPTWTCESTFDCFACCHCSYLMASPLIGYLWMYCLFCHECWPHSVQHPIGVLWIWGDKAVLFWWVFSLCVMDHDATRIHSSSWTHTLEPLFLLPVAITPSPPEAPNMLLPATSPFLRAPGECLAYPHKHSLLGHPMKPAFSFCLALSPSGWWEHH